MRCLVIALTILLSSTSALAQRAGYISGAGMAECGLYLSRSNENNVGVLYQFTEWVNGYLSAYNQYGTKKQIENMPSYDTLKAYLDMYCRDHPLSNVMAAAGCLIAESGGYQAPHCK